MKQRKDQSQNLPTKALTVKEILTNLKIFCTAEFGMTLKRVEDTNKAYDYFLNIFIDIYDKLFPKSEVKFKSDQSPLITKRMTKISKKKQRLYEKFLNNRIPKKEETYKTYENILEAI